MKRLGPIILGCLGGVLALLTVAVSDDSMSARPLILRNCPIQPLHDVKVPVRVAGVLQKINVKEGTLVNAGDTMAVVDDRLARIEMEAKKEATLNNAPIETARARLTEAQAQFEDAEKLFNRKVLSREEYRVKDAQLKIAQFGVEDAQNQMKLTNIELKGAEAELDMHKVPSPIEGVVVQQVRQQGEAVQALDPIFRVIRTDVVKVEGAVNVRDADRVREGMTIDVYPDRTVGPTLVFLGHTGPVHAVEVLGDGAHCVSGGSEGAIIVWDVRRGSQYKVLTEHMGPVFTLATDPKNPNLLVSGGADHILRVWDIENGTVTREIKDPMGVILSAKLSPVDPNICVTGHDDRIIRVWNLETGTMVRDMRGHTNYVTALDMTPDGKTLMSVGNDGTVRFWNMEDGKSIARYPGRTSEVTQLDLSPDGKNFLFNSYNLLQVRTVPDGLPVANFESRSGPFSNVSVFSPVPGLVLTGSDNRQLELWQQGADGQNARLVRTYEGSQDPVLCVDFAPKGNYFVSGSVDRAVRVWETPTIERINSERIRGKISFVNRQVEAGSQTLSILAEVDNKDGLLVPGSFATIVVYPTPRAEHAANP